MKMYMQPTRAFIALASAAIMFASCQKNDLNNQTTDPSSDPQTIAVAANATSGVNGTTGPADSVYLVQTCKQGEKRSAIAQSDLPASVAAYLSANYSGATFFKAFKVKKNSASVAGYIVIIYYNDKPVGLAFDNGGNFVKVLEQREKADLNGPGHHHGGLFDFRDGKGRDSIALSALPASVSAYMSTNYAGDTLVKAFINKHGTIILLSRNNGLFATVFKANGSFYKHQQLPCRPGHISSIELAALPSAAAAYLAAAYPNYVFDKAFKVTDGGNIKGYVVIIDANNTKYAVEFDAGGSFVRSKTIH